jgi:uncharacterized SAM-binding protein YcdF (DUF218 family)
MLKRLARAIRMTLMAIGLLVVVCTFTPVNYWYATLLAGPWQDPKGEILIVLGGGMERDGFPSRSTLRRMMYAALTWREGGFRKIIVCGGTGTTDKPVAGVIRDYLVFAGIPADAIIMETGSHSTRENAAMAARLLAHESGAKVLLSSDYHMFRASRAFRKAGIEVRPRPVPDIRQRQFLVEQRWASVVELSVESVKIVYYFARGWI